MPAGVIVGGIGGAVLVVVIVGMWLRIRQLKTDKTELREKATHERAAHDRTKEQLTTTAQEAREAKRRYKRHIEVLREEIEGLRDDLDGCTDPEVLRDRVNRLSQKLIIRELP